MIKTRDNDKSIISCIVLLIPYVNTIGVSTTRINMSCICLWLIHRHSMDEVKKGTTLCKYWVMASCHLTLILSCNDQTSYIFLLSQASIKS